MKKVTELKNFGLVLNNFALSDPTTDILQLLQANQIASDDISDLNSHLQKSQRKFHNLFQNSNDAIFLQTHKGDILDSNIKAQILAGKPNAVPYLVNDGKEVMEILEIEQFDLLILDMQMPIMDGYETLERLKASKFYESLPVIALTANATQGEKDRVLKLGADEYLAKPFNSKDLYSKIAGLTEHVCDWQKAVDPTVVE